MKLVQTLCLSALLAVSAAWGADRSESMRHDTTISPVALPPVDDSAILGSGVDLLHSRDSDRFRSTRLRAGALVRYESPYDLVAIGGGGTHYRQDDWSTDGYTLVGVVRKQERATGAGVLATVGVSTVGDQQKLIGEGSWNIRTSRAGGLEFVAQRDFVETRPALENGIMSDYLAASIDHAVTDRLTIYGLAGEQWFSDDNRRTHLRGRAIYALLPEQGISVQARVRTYESSRAGGIFYFNPENYERADIGLRLRRSIGDWRVLASAGGGTERINRDVEKPTRYIDLHAEHFFANKMALILTVAIARSSESDSASTASDYTWRYYRAQLAIPF